jgi:hypothetical protein
VVAVLFLILAALAVRGAVARPSPTRWWITVLGIVAGLAVLGVAA